MQEVRASGQLRSELEEHSTLPGLARYHEEVRDTRKYEMPRTGGAPRSVQKPMKTNAKLIDPTVIAFHPSTEPLLAS